MCCVQAGPGALTSCALPGRRDLEVEERAPEIFCGLSSGSDGHNRWPWMWKLDGEWVRGEDFPY